jgi:penicillin-binding protein 1A
MIADVITSGTGRRAIALGRSDLGGKTGTTNDAKDVWFNGFNRSLVASGLGRLRPGAHSGSGETEEGSRTAAADLGRTTCSEALEGRAAEAAPDARAAWCRCGSRHTRAPIASADDPNAIFETFIAEPLAAPAAVLGGDASGYGAGSGSGATISGRPGQRR